MKIARITGPSVRKPSIKLADEVVVLPKKLCQLYAAGQINNCLSMIMQTSVMLREIGDHAEKDALEAHIQSLETIIKTLENKAAR